MGRGNAVLQRKLEEVESGIGRLLEHPPSMYIRDDNDDRKVSLYRTARKIDFIKNLLTAEMNSRSPHRPENLNRIATRLSILQKAFVEWASPTNRLDETFANGVESADNDMAVDKCPDTSASGSCTKSKHEKIRDRKGKRKVMGDENQEEEREGGSKVEATKDEKQEETGEGTVEVNEDEKEGREKKEAERKAKVNEDEKVGEKKQESEMVQERNVVAKKDGYERDGDREEKTVGEVETTEEQQCHGVRSCMAMGCAAIAGFTSALILVALANIAYVGKTVYLVPT